MSSTIDNKEASNKGNRKTIQINQDFFKIGKKGNAPITGTRKAKQNHKPLANNTIKQALAKRVQERKQKDLDEVYQRRSDAQASPREPVQTELSKSLSYLNEFVKNKKKKAMNSKKTTMKATREPMVNVDLPNELIANILPAPMSSLVQPPFPVHLPSTVNTVGKSIIDVVTPTKYTYNTTPPPYSNLKTSTTGKPTYKVWNQTRKQRGTHVQNNRPQQTTNTHTLSKPIVFNTSVNTSTSLENSKTSERENKLAFAKSAITTPIQQAVTTPPLGPRIIKRSIIRKYTVGRKIGGRKVSVLIKNLKTRRNIQEAKKQLKKTETSEIKKYLKSHGLLKVGSVAPNNVLREMYESAMMGGDIHNTNGQVALHNFNADDE